MSLATRCTSCGTIFRVVQDQLKVSEGWVRCGRCQEVFSALEGLFDLEREAPPQRVENKPGASEDAGGANSGDAPSPIAPESTDFDPFAHPDPAAEPQSFASTSEDDAIESRFLVHPEERGRTSGDEAAADFFSSRFDLGRTASADGAAAADAGGMDDAAVPPAAGAANASLMGRWRHHRESRQSALASSMLDAGTADGATPQPSSSDESDAAPASTYLGPDAAPSRWSTRRARTGLSVGAVLLVGALLAQVGYQFRDVFAAQWPQSRGALAALCEWTGCTIEPLRRLAAVTVEDSGLTQVQGADAYRLSVTLHNRSAFEVAIPSIDLTLTDGAGGLVARRSLSPSDFSGAPALAAGTTLATLAPGSEAQLQALLASSGARITGYTVELFYP